MSDPPRTQYNKIHSGCYQCERNTVSQQQCRGGTNSRGNDTCSAHYCVNVLRTAAVHHRHFKQTRAVQLTKRKQIERPRKQIYIRPKRHSAQEKYRRHDKIRSHSCRINRRALINRIIFKTAAGNSYSRAVECYPIGTYPECRHDDKVRKFVHNTRRQRAKSRAAFIHHEKQRRHGEKRKIKAKLRSHKFYCYHAALYSRDIRKRTAASR